MIWLVVEPPSWKRLDFVNWDDDIPNTSGKIIQSCSKATTRIGGEASNTGHEPETLLGLSDWELLGNCPSSLGNKNTSDAMNEERRGIVVMLLCVKKLRDNHFISFYQLHTKKKTPLVECRRSVQSGLEKKGAGMTDGDRSWVVTSLVWTKCLWVSNFSRSSSFWSYLNPAINLDSRTAQEIPIMLVKQ